MSKQNMKIGIDISQLAYAETGVSNYLFHVIKYLIEMDNRNNYVLFYSSLRKKLPVSVYSLIYTPHVSIIKYRFPPTILDLLWNRLHILPIEWLVGHLDIFISSDWTQPPTSSAIAVTILYDLVVLKYPSETAKVIIDVQKRRLKWVQKEVKKIICISESTKRDAIELLQLDEKKLSVIYPGI